MSNSTKQEKKRMGRPRLNPKVKRVSVTFNVAPNTRDYFVSKSKETKDSRGVLLDKLVTDAQGTTYGGVPLFLPPVGEAPHSIRRVL